MSVRPRWTVCVAVLLLGACAPRDETPRLVLIGIDGGSWNLVDPLLAAGELPHLAALRDRGMSAELTAAPHVFTGDHGPVGIFLAAGRAIRHRPERDRLSVLDVAPLLTYLAAQPLPDDFEGGLDPGVAGSGSQRGEGPLFRYRIQL